MRACLSAVFFATLATLPLRAVADDVPASIVALLPKGDTAFEEPPMLEMVVADFDQQLEQAAQPLQAVLSSPGSEPGVVAVGDIQQEQRANGFLYYVQFQEDCRTHPKGFKTPLRGAWRSAAWAGSTHEGLSSWWWLSR